MENTQKAIIMGTSVLLFVIALSIAVYLYTTLYYNVDSILTTSENNERTAEFFISQEQDTTRVVSKAEIVMSIINLYSSNDYVYNKIVVNGNEFIKGTDYSNTSALNTLAKSDNNFYYVYEENHEAKVIKYRNSEG